MSSSAVAIVSFGPNLNMLGIEKLKAMRQDEALRRQVMDVREAGVSKDDPVGAAVGAR